jgi:ABC-2 type transport system ATP-binding protein
VTTTAVREPVDLLAAPPVQVRGLVKRYGSRSAVDQVDLDVEPGEVVGFLGPNGAGKTTVLRVLTGALRASAGRVSLQGRDPFRDGAAARQGVGYLPGDLRLPGDLVGHEVLDLCAVGRADPGSQRVPLATALDVPLDVPVAELSKGNRQKLGIVQALMSEPRVLLLDEPTSGLDPLAQEVLAQLLRSAASRGTAVLLSSHVLREVERVADRVVMLRAGQVVASSRLDELRAAAPHDVVVEVADPEAAVRLSGVPGVLGLAAAGKRLSFTVPTGSLPLLLRALAAEQVLDVSITPAELDTLFRHLYERG